MDHQKKKELISFYHEGELSAGEKRTVEEHLEHCAECRKEFAEMGEFEEVMRKMQLKKPQKEIWEAYWSTIYNRLERKIGWILLSIGAIILLFFGGYKAIEGIIQDPSLSVLLKVGILAALGGVVVLLVSLLREQIFVHKRERYKEVEK